MTRQFTRNAALALVCTGLLIEATALVFAQTTGRAQTSRSRYNTPYMANYNPYAASYSANQAALYRQAVSPVTSSALPPVSGHVEKYSPVEYGKIVQMTVDAARRNTPQAAAPATTRLIDLATTKTPTGQTVYAPVNMAASQVLDRGIILLPTGEELRLRGVDMPSATTSNDVLRLYAKEGMQALSTMISDKPLTMLLDDPLRDNTGRILATIILPDGTEVNKQMLQSGYGSVKPDDFALGVEFSDLKSAQETAKAARLGIWSGR